MTAPANITACFNAEKEKADKVAIETDKRHKRAEKTAAKRRCASDVVTKMVVQRKLKEQNLEYLDESGRAVDRDFLPQVAECQKFVQMMATSYPDIMNMETEASAISRFKSAVATGRGKSVRARQFVDPIARQYVDTYHSHLYDVQEHRRSTGPVSETEDTSESEVGVDDLIH